MEMLTLLLCLSNLVMGAKFCTASNQLCIISTVSPTNDTCFTIHSVAGGWAAIGVGTNVMTGSDMYIGWKNSTNGVSVFNFKGVAGHKSPAPASSQSNIVSIPALLDPKPAWSKLSFSFCRSATASPVMTASTNYIYGAAMSAPSSNLESSSAPLRIHDDGYFGTFNVNFLSVSAVAVGSSNGAILQTTPTFTYKMVCEIHGSLMWVAWTLCPLIAIFVARYGKDILGHNWYRIHMGLMGGITFLFTIAGFTIIFLYRPPQHFTSLSGMIADVHVKAGLAVSIGVVFQVALGYLSNHLWSPNRTYIPLVDKLHWWFGRLLTLLGIGVCYLGFLVYQSRFQVMPHIYLILFWIFVGFGLALFAWGEWKIGQVHHLASKDDDKKA